MSLGCRVTAEDAENQASGAPKKTAPQAYKFLRHLVSPYVP